jgi:hypothetical protein
MSVLASSPPISSSTAFATGERAFSLRASAAVSGSAALHGYWNCTRFSGRLRHEIAVVSWSSDWLAGQEPFVESCT